mmetsp:Transcript_16923/g.45541  ORF Transcript_16923/g.45541 Transcript_16923/m.45541 type:complete len:204 (-) Transcript_16923:149-760(-)
MRSTPSRPHATRPCARVSTLRSSACSSPALSLPATNGASRTNTTRATRRTARLRSRSRRATVSPTWPAPTRSWLPSRTWALRCCTLGTWPSMSTLAASRGICPSCPAGRSGPSAFNSPRLAWHSPRTCSGSWRCSGLRPRAPTRCSRCSSRVASAAPRAASRAPSRPCSCASAASLSSESAPPLSRVTPKAVACAGGQDATVT